MTTAIDVCMDDDSDTDSANENSTIRHSSGELDIFQIKMDEYQEFKTVKSIPSRSGHDREQQANGTVAQQVGLDDNQQDKDNESDDDSTIDQKSIETLGDATTRKCHCLLLDNKDKDDKSVVALRHALRSMQHQLHFLQSLVQQARPKHSQTPQPASLHHRSRASTTTELMIQESNVSQSAQLASAALSPVRKSSADPIMLHAMDDSSLFQLSPTRHGGGSIDSKADVHLKSGSPCSRRSRSPTAENGNSTNVELLMNRVAQLEQENVRLLARLEEQTCTEQVSKKVISEFVHQTEELNSRLNGLEQENQELRNAVEATRHQQSQNPPIRSNGRRVPKPKETDDIVQPRHGECSTSASDCKCMSTSFHDIRLNDSMESMMTNQCDIPHDRCQEKLHELWQTVRTLKTFAETYRAEKEELARQRDDAVQSAERAWEENAKLAGHSNSNQKIRYLQTIKNENAILQQKVRELQARAAMKRIHHSKGQSQNARGRDTMGEDLNASTGSLVMSSPERNRRMREISRLAESPPWARSNNNNNNSMQSANNSTLLLENDRNQLFRKMWNRNKRLQREIERLKDEQLKLMSSDGSVGHRSRRGSMASSPTN